MSQAILSVENVSKKFCRDLKRSLWYGVKDLSSEILLRRNGGAELRRDEFWALRDISFELTRGKTLGLIGHNGAGKSTLLKLINGLIKPDRGCIRVWGRVGALIELGTGFNPVLTGRENIYVNAAVLGLPRREVDRRLDEIIDFAEIGDFIDAPVQSYSSGMAVRLGFSIAAHLNPDLLLIDEILSVGDASFRRRCFERLISFKRKGGTIIVVSHNSRVVEAISDQVILLYHGHLSAIGQPDEVIPKYELWGLEQNRQFQQATQVLGRSNNGDEIWFSAVECRDTAGNSKSQFEFGEPFEVRLHYEGIRELQHPYFVIGIEKSSYKNSYVALMSMLWDGMTLETIPKQGVVRCSVGGSQLTPGHYSLHIGVQSEQTSMVGKKWYAELRQYTSFSILPTSLKTRFPGIASDELVRMPPVILNCSWQLNGI